MSRDTQEKCMTWVALRVMHDTSRLYWHTATHCNTLQHTATQKSHDAQEGSMTRAAFRVMTRAVPIDILKHTATRCNTKKPCYISTVWHEPSVLTYWNTLQHAATCCNMLPLAATKISHGTDQRHDTSRLYWTTATHCNTLYQSTATHCNALQLSASWHEPSLLTHCNTLYKTLQHSATHCNTLQHKKAMAQINDTTRAVSIDTLQHTATHCNTLQHTVLKHCTHCNTL